MTECHGGATAGGSSLRVGPLHRCSWSPAAAQEVSVVLQDDVIFLLLLLLTVTIAVVTTELAVSVSISWKPPPVGSGSFCRPDPDPPEGLPVSEVPVPVVGVMKMMC